METVSLSDFADKRWKLYGVDGNCFAAKEEGTRKVRFFEAVEDESDGYRSCLDEVRELTKEEVAERYLVFFERSVAVATATLCNGYFDGLEFSDGDHVWLQVGTDNADDYYPGFCFTWSPKAP